MIYEYLCDKHGEFEAEQKITEEPLKECPQCVTAGEKHSPPKRLISASSFQLTGGGWASSGYS